ncbi:MAG: hypothetical protein ACOX5R_12535 [bacterium]|jgi:hypothetical protein
MLRGLPQNLLPQSIPEMLSECLQTQQTKRLINISPALSDPEMIPCILYYAGLLQYRHQGHFQYHPEYKGNDLWY